MVNFKVKVKLGVKIRVDSGLWLVIKGEVLVNMKHLANILIGHKPMSLHEANYWQVYPSTLHLTMW